MSANAVPNVLLVGRAPSWGHHAANALLRQSIDAHWVPEVAEAVTIVKSDRSITTVVFAEDLNKDALVAGMTRMAVARPELFMVVLAAEYDVNSMAKYLQLGQREAGPLRVRYLQNDYDYDRLPNVIREVAEPVERVEQHLATLDVDMQPYVAWAISDKKKS